MSISTHEPPAAPVESSIGPLFRLSVDQYAEMVRLEILTEDDRVELLEGVLVAKMSRNPPHVFCARRIMSTLMNVLPTGWSVAKGDAIQTSDSVPEPDCSVLRGDPRDYADRWPGPDDMPLVVEVAESSLARDRVVKRRHYGPDEEVPLVLDGREVARFAVRDLLP